jgi:hypothetical protein
MPSSISQVLGRIFPRPQSDPSFRNSKVNTNPTVILKPLAAKLQRPLSQGGSEQSTRKPNQSATFLSTRPSSNRMNAPTEQSQGVGRIRAEDTATSSRTVAILTSPSGKQQPLETMHPQIAQRLRRERSQAIARLIETVQSVQLKPLPKPPVLRNGNGIANPDDSTIRAYRDEMSVYQNQLDKRNGIEAVDRFVAARHEDENPQVFQFIPRHTQDSKKLFESMENIEAKLAGSASGTASDVSRISLDELKTVLGRLNDFHQVALKDQTPEGKRMARFLENAMANAVSTMIESWVKTQGDIQVDAVQSVISETIRDAPAARQANQRATL